jgi:hypothetical protein
VLQDLLREDIEDFENLPIEIVEDEVYDNGRWTVHHRLIFSHGNKHYQVDYQRGSTEYQDERPFEYDSNDIVCILVEKKEVTVTRFMPVNE